MIFGDFLTIQKDYIHIDDNKQYVIAGVQNYGRGVVERREVNGYELKMKKYQPIKSDQLMWCKVDTKNGAFGITSSNIEGALASTNMCLAQIDTTKVYPPLLQLLFTMPWFYEYINSKSSGTTNRKYLTPKQILAEIELPDLSLTEQKGIVTKYNHFNKSELSSEIDSQLNYIQLLRQTILQEAVQGKLVPQESNDEPASELLKKIQAEKEQQIKDKKIKKPKPLPPITDDEISYELPEGWVWCRMGDVILYSEAGKSVVCEKRPAESNEWGVIKVSAMSWGSFLEQENKALPKAALPCLDYQIKVGDYLISRANTDELIGKSVIVNSIDSNLLLSDKSIRIVFSQQIDKHYINQFNNSGISRAYYKSVASGTSDSMKNITREHMYLLPTPLPPLAEQQRIVAKVEQLMQLCDNLEVQVQQSKTDAEQLLQAVLREAFERAETKRTKPKEASWEFKESVLISMLTNKFGSMDFPLGRKRYTKLSYLFHRHLTDDSTSKYVRKAAGPYNPKTKYKGPEQIAVTNKYIKPYNKGKYNGFVAGEAISSAIDYFSRYWDKLHIDWLEQQFKYKTNDELELYATVDNALIELYKKGVTPSVSHIKSIIKNEPEWRDKLKKSVFSDESINLSIDHLLKLFSYNE